MKDILCCLHNVVDSISTSTHGMIQSNGLVVHSVGGGEFGLETSLIQSTSCMVLVKPTETVNIQQDFI